MIVNPGCCKEKGTPGVAQGALNQGWFSLDDASPVKDQQGSDYQETNDCKDYTEYHIEPPFLLPFRNGYQN